MAFEFKKAFTKLIERTHDPMGPVKLQEAYKYAELVGKMLIPAATKTEVEAYTSLLLSQWPDEEIDEVCGNPSFIVAISGIFTQSLVRYAIETYDGVEDIT